MLLKSMFKQFVSYDYEYGAVYPRQEEEPDGVPGCAADRHVPKCEGKARVVVSIATD